MFIHLLLSSYLHIQTLFSYVKETGTRDICHFVIPNLYDTKLDT